MKWNRLDKVELKLNGREVLVRNIDHREEKPHVVRAVVNNLYHIGNYTHFAEIGDDDEQNYSMPS